MKDEMQPRFGEPIADWYRYFAWRPVSTLDRGWRWFSIVWKRKCQPHSYLSAPMTPFFQYRATKPPQTHKSKTWKIAMTEEYVEVLTVEAETEDEAIKQAYRSSHFAQPEFLEVAEYPDEIDPTNSNKEED